VRAHRLGILAMVVVSASCSTLETGAIGIITGGDDAGPFNEPPCAEGGTPFCGPTPTTIVISEITSENSEGGTSTTPTVIATEPYNGASTITLPPISSDDVDIIQATAYDSADAAIIFGETLPVSVGGIDGLTLDLFVQRRGQFAIMPSPFPDPLDAPLVTLFEGRYILAVTGSSAILYDILLSSLPENGDGGQAPQTLPCTPLSMAPVAGTTFMLLICAGDDEKDGASGDLTAYQYDVSEQSAPLAVTAPAGGSTCEGVNTWRSVAGGATVIAPNGDVFIVGGTRPKSSGLGPTSCVVKVGAAVVDDDAGTTTLDTPFYAFQAQRQGAAAVWSSGAYGLVVLGGNTSSKDPGVEYFAGVASDEGGIAATHESINYPADMTQGEGATAIGLGQSTILVAGGLLPDGGVAPVRRFDLTCTSSSCGPDGGGGSDASVREGGASEGGKGKDAGSSASLVPLLTAQGFSETSMTAMGLTAPTEWADGALFVGKEKDELTHAFLVSSTGLSVLEVPLHDAMRKGATAVLTPVPSVVVLGGDVTMESFIP
jgi:hypothetical protein